MLENGWEPLTGLQAKDGTKITGYHWPLPKEKVKGLVQITHGMAEHAGRYDYFAKKLQRSGFAVIAHDHRGHGPNCAPAKKGYFADRDGWAKVTGDIKMVSEAGRRYYPGAGLILFGHSMGSFFAQQYFINWGSELAALVLSGSSHGQPAAFIGLKGMAMLEALRQGQWGKSPLLKAVSFGSFNDRFKPARTDFDWLSRDTQQVDRYVTDPHCGFDCSNRLWQDMGGGLANIFNPVVQAKMPKKVPVYLVCGENDPVGGKKGIPKLRKSMLACGVKQVDLKIFDDCRHEIVNEINRDEIIADIIGWMSKHI